MTVKFKKARSEATTARRRPGMQTLATIEGNQQRLIIGYILIGSVSSDWTNSESVCRLLVS